MSPGNTSQPGRISSILDIKFLKEFNKSIHLSRLMTKQNGMCAERRLRLAWASDQSLRCPHEESFGP